MTRVVSMPAVVVLPAPLGPSRPKISPGWTLRLRASTALKSVPGYCLVRSTVRMMSSSGVPAGACWVAVVSDSVAGMGVLQGSVNRRDGGTEGQPLIVGHVPRQTRLHGGGHVLELGPAFRADLSQLDPHDAAVELVPSTRDQSFSAQPVEVAGQGWALDTDVR